MSVSISDNISKTAKLTLPKFKICFTLDREGFQLFQRVEVMEGTIPKVEDIAPRKNIPHQIKIIFFSKKAPSLGKESRRYGTIH